MGPKGVPAPHASPHYCLGSWTLRDSGVSEVIARAFMLVPPLKTLVTPTLPACPMPTCSNPPPSPGDEDRA